MKFSPSILFVFFPPIYLVQHPFEEKRWGAGSWKLRWTWRSSFSIATMVIMATRMMGTAAIFFGGKTGEYEKAKLLIWGENRSHLESQRVKYL